MRKEDADCMVLSPVGSQLVTSTLLVRKKVRIFSVPVLFTSLALASRMGTVNVRFVPLGQGKAEDIPAGRLHGRGRLTGHTG
jgi:hypothetical protein